MSQHDQPLREPVGISPRVDCVFKAIMGDPAHAHLLLDFLNAVIAPEVPITAVEIQNPVHLPDFVGDDFTAVDVQATDATGRIFQVEMQSRNESALKERALYTWADIYEGQLESGQGYNELRPVISIWLLDENTLRNAPYFHHRFVVCDPVRQVVLTRHLEIHTLELEKWRANPTSPSQSITAWMSFFAEAETWSDLPSALKSSALEEAMAVLHEFNTNAKWNAVYRSRRDGLRRQLTYESVLAQALEDTERERAAKEQERAEKEQERAAKEQERAAKEQERAAKERERAAKEQERAEKERERAAKEQERAAKEQERAEKERALAEKETALAEKERALEELEKLRLALRRAGVDPEQR